MWANAQAAIPGAAVLFIIGYITGQPVTFPDGPLGLLMGALASAVAAWVLIFFARLVYWPIHRKVEPYGGLLPALQKNLGAQMWPVILMVSGIASFLLLFGGGAIWAIMQATNNIASHPATEKGFVSYEIERQLKAIDFFRDNLLTVEALGSEGRDLSSALSGGFQQGRLPPTVTAEVVGSYAKHLEKELKELQEVWRKNDQYEYMRRTLPGGADPISTINPFETVTATLRLAQDLRKVGEAATAAEYSMLLNNQHFVAFSKAVIELGNWAGIVRNSLLQARIAVAALPVANAKRD